MISEYCEITLEEEIARLQGGSYRLLYLPIPNLRRLD